MLPPDAWELIQKIDSSSYQILAIFGEGLPLAYSFVYKTFRVASIRGSLALFKVVKDLKPSHRPCLWPFRSPPRIALFPPRANLDLDKMSHDQTTSSGTLASDPEQQSPIGDNTYSKDAKDARHTIDDTESEDSPSDNVQAGVKQAEAITLTWTKKSLGIAYIL